jgi:hypothetical protein
VFSSEKVTNFDLLIFLPCLRQLFSVLTADVVLDAAAPKLNPDDDRLAAGSSLDGGWPALLLKENDDEAVAGVAALPNAGTGAEAPNIDVAALADPNVLD